MEVLINSHHSDGSGQNRKDCQSRADRSNKITVVNNEASFEIEHSNLTQYPRSSFISCSTCCGEKSEDLAMLTYDLKAPHSLVSRPLSQPFSLLFAFFATSETEPNHNFSLIASTASRKTQDLQFLWSHMYSGPPRRVQVSSLHKDYEIICSSLFKILYQTHL